MKKKIYITALHLMHGGVEMAIVSLANALVKRGHTVEILCTYQLGNPAYSLDNRVKVSYLTNVKPNKEAFFEAIRRKNCWAIVREGVYAARVLYLKKRVLKEQFRKITEGVIISTRNEDSVLLSRYGNPDVLKIAQLHHDHCFDKKLLRDFKKNYRNIDFFTVLTDQLQTEIAEFMKSNHHTRCVTMPNFIPQENQTEVLSENIENQVVAVGRLHEVKGFLRLINIWKIVAEKHDTILKIIGGGEQQRELEQEIERLGLKKSVILTGSMNHEDVLKEMKKSLCYVMTSLSEGFGFVIIEAMSQGTPVIAYDVRVGPRAIIEDGKNGFLVFDGNKDVFIEKIDLLVTNPAKREQLSQAAFIRAADFSEEVIMKKWEILLSEA